MWSNDLDPDWIEREYKTRLEWAENERLALQLIRSQPSPPSRLLMVIANTLIAAGTRLRDFACSEPCEATPETARL